MKREYISLFEKAAPRMSDEELLNAVLSSRKGSITMKNNTKNTENKSKKFFSKAVVIPLAAALALGATAVGAVAVYNRSVADEYNNVLAPGASIFEQEYKNADGEAATQPVNIELYEQMNIAIDKTFKCDGCSVEIPGAVTDGKDMIVLYNVIFDKDPTNGELAKAFMGYTPVTEGVGYGCGRFDEGMGFSKRDGKTVLSGFFELSKLEKVTADTIKVKLESLWGDEDLWNDGALPLDIDLEIPLTSDITRFNKTVEIPSKPHIDLSAWGEWNMTDVEITPLSVTFNMSFDETSGTMPAPVVHKDASPDFPMIVTFKDGTTLDISDHAGMTHGIHSDTRTTMIQRPFNFPINVDDVQSVQIASAVINVDGTAQTVEIPEINDHYAVHGGEK
ncbi:MAG: hypothetical protein K2J77_04040 [Oscillospiraceae bacterium]|nr:hypothetical protein [Oscillospiraceae bacterium]